MVSMLSRLFWPAIQEARLAPRSEKSPRASPDNTKAGQTATSTGTGETDPRIRRQAKETPSPTPTTFRVARSARQKKEPETMFRKRQTAYKSILDVWHFLRK